MARSKNNNELSATTLKEILWDTMNAVKNETIEPNQASAIANQAKHILSTVKVQLQVASQTSRAVPAEVIAFSEQ